MEIIPDDDNEDERETLSQKKIELAIGVCLILIVYLLSYIFPKLGI